MKTRPKNSPKGPAQKRRAIRQLFCALDTLIAAAKEADRAKRTILHAADEQREESRHA